MCCNGPVFHSIKVVFQNMPFMAILWESYSVEKKNVSVSSTFLYKQYASTVFVVSTGQF